MGHKVNRHRMDDGYTNWCNDCYSILEELVDLEADNFKGEKTINHYEVYCPCNSYTPKVVDIYIFACQVCSYKGKPMDIFVKYDNIEVKKWQNFPKFIIKIVNRSTNEQKDLSSAFLD